MVTGLMMSDKSFFDKVCSDLKNLFGDAVFISRWIDFNHSDYYKAEMGTNLKKRFILFKTPVSQDALAGIKLGSTDIENFYLENGKRRVNIDPGILTKDKFVLSTFKNYSHRIYLGRSVFAEVALVYEKSCFRPFEWTYLDYKTDEAIVFFQLARKYLIFLHSAQNFVNCE
ncbi:MAG: DUF4416 family protein [Thermodesulfobacteriota bacterium]